MNETKKINKDNPYFYETKLIPINDSRASFYGKARVRTEEDKLVLISYNTKVAEIDFENNEAIVFDTYSKTTLRHIKEFLLQNGFKAENKKQILEDYDDK